MTELRKTEFYLEVAKGNVPKHSIVSIFGLNPNVGLAAFEDIWGVGGLLVQPVAGETWEIVSTDANDTLAGTGARTVIVAYLDTDYIERTQEIEMNGITPVSLAGSDQFRHAASAVLSVGSGKKNAGDIFIRNSSGGTNRSVILTADNITQDSHYTVPAGKSLYLVHFVINVNKNEDIQTRLFVADPTLGTEFEVYEISAYQSTIESQILPIKFGEKQDIRWAAKSTNANARASSVLYCVLVED